MLAGAMAKCDLTVRLDEGSTVVRQGDPITGEVIVRVDEFGRCDGLALVCEWFTRGSGNPESGEASREVLHTGDWWPGEHRYRFTVAAPLGPMSSDGEAIAIGWRVVARADLAWARDAVAGAEFRLLPRPDASLEEPYYFGPSYGILAGDLGAELKLSETPSGEAAKKGSWWAWMAGALLVVTLAVAMPPLLLLMSPFIVYAVIHNLLVRDKLGRPELKVVPRVTHPGGTVEVTVAITPRRDVLIESLFVELVADANATKGHGKGARTIQTRLYTRRERFGSVARELRAGERIEETVRLEIPADGQYSFHASANTILWRVDARAIVPRWPDWHASVVVAVRPGRASAASRELPRGPG